MSKTKIILYSIFYVVIAIIIFIIIGTFLEKYSISEMLARMILSFTSILILYLYLKFNIISHEHINEKMFWDKVTMIPIYLVVIFLHFTEPYHPLINNMVLKVIIISFFIGLSEEVFFRGILYNLFYYNKIIFLMISTLLFALFHYDQASIGIFFASFVGLALGMARLSKTPLWILILTHAMIDIPSMIGKNYDHVYSLETKILRYHGLRFIGIFTVIILGIYIEYKKNWKFDFKGEKLESKSLWKYFTS